MWKQRGKRQMGQQTFACQASFESEFGAPEAFDAGVDGLLLYN
jgi:hypothetical protein